MNRSDRRRTVAAAKKIAKKRSTAQRKGIIHAKTYTFVRGVRVPEALCGDISKSPMIQLEGEVVTCLSCLSRMADREDDG